MRPGPVPCSERGIEFPWGQPPLLPAVSVLGALSRFWPERVRRGVVVRARAGKRLAHDVRLRWDFGRALRARSAITDVVDGAGRVSDPFIRAAADALDRDGFVHLPRAFDPEGLRDVLRECEEALATGRHLPIVRVHPEEGKPKALTPEELALGQAYAETRAHIAFVADPFVSCPSSLRYVFSDLVIDLAHAAYGAPAALVAGKIVMSYVNDLPRTGFFCFHCDSQATRIIKFFFYLRDVDEGGGPFCYVRGSHRRRIPGQRRRDFWSDEAIESFYGKDNVLALTAKAGDVVVANTVGFHRASKPRTRRRLAMVVSTGVHPFEGRVRLRAADLEGLSARQRSMADFAELV